MSCSNEFRSKSGPWASHMLIPHLLRGKEQNLLQTFSQQKKKRSKFNPFLLDRNGNQIHKHKICSILSSHSKLPLDRLLRVRNWQRALTLETVDQLQKLEKEESVSPSEENPTPSDLDPDPINDIYSTSAEELALPKIRKIQVEGVSSIPGKNPSAYRNFKEIEEQATQKEKKNVRETTKNNKKNKKKKISLNVEIPNPTQLIVETQTQK
jgi:hypothetical protein